MAADAALYEAKRAGRNRVYAAGYAPEVEPQTAVVRRSAPLNNLPRQQTRLISRLTEVSEITALLEELGDSGARHCERRCRRLHHRGAAAGLLR